MQIQTYVRFWQRVVVMDRRKIDVSEMTNEEYQINYPDYKKLIIEMVNKISDIHILIKIYTFVKAWL